MAKFRIMPHSRLQEWVAEEKGYFRDEGLDYEFITPDLVDRFRNPTIESEEEAPAEVKSGAFESMEAGRACEVSSACHWAVNMAAHAESGRMWGHAYSMTPSGIWVAPESPIQKPEDLADVEVAVGYHSGSHFSALQALENFLPKEQIKLQFVGGPLDRLQLSLDRRVQSANVFGTPSYVLEQQGFRKVLDTSFMIGFLINGNATDEQLWAYFNALQRAQREIDLAKELYQHYFLKELPERYHSMFDHRRAGIGERLIFEPYTKENFEKTHRWMIEWEIFPKDQVGSAEYEKVVVA
jgi:NitT/TauT family transport system substrate-binding protein